MARPSVYAFLLMMSYLAHESVGQQGAPLANFLIRPSSGNSFSNLQISNENVKQTESTHSVTDSSTSGIDLEVSLPLTSPAPPTTAVTNMTPDPPTVVANVRALLPVGEHDLFPEFLPVDNTTVEPDLTVAVPAAPTSSSLEEEQLATVGSGDGEIIEGTTGLSSVRSSTLPPVELAVSTTAVPPLTHQVPLDTTIPPSMGTPPYTTSDHSTFSATTRGRLGFYQFRESSMDPQQGAVDTTTTVYPPSTVQVELDGAATDLSFATILHRLNDTKADVVPAVPNAPLEWNLGEVPNAPPVGPTDPHSTVAEFAVPLVNSHVPTADLSSSTPNESPLSTPTTNPEIPAVGSERVVAFDHLDALSVPMDAVSSTELTLLPVTVLTTAVPTESATVPGTDPILTANTVNFPAGNPTLQWTSDAGVPRPTELSDPNSVVPHAGSADLPHHHKGHQTTDLPSTTLEIGHGFRFRESRILEADYESSTPAALRTASPTPAKPGSFPKKGTTRKFYWTVTPSRATVATTVTTPSSGTTNSTSLPTMTTDRLMENTTLQSNNSGVSELPMENTTAWHFPLLPEQRNVDQGLGEEKAGHEGWAPFTIPDTNLAKFLFSTLIPSVIGENSTEKMATIFPATTSQPGVTSKVHKHTHVTHHPPANVSHQLQGTQVTDALEWPVVDLITTKAAVTETSTFTVTTVTVGATDSPVTVTTTSPMVYTAVTMPDTNTTYPRPMLFWSDKPESSSETRKLFADDTDGWQLLPATTNEQQDNGINSLPKHNISRDALDNLITVVMRYVGQQDFIFNDTDKKTLAELIFWPIMHETSRANVNSSRSSSTGRVVRRDATGGSGGDAVPWPILRFMAKTPKLIDGVWVVVAYVTYKDKESTVMPRSRLLTLFHDAELKIMTKMNMQLVRVFPGLPILPFNATDLRHHPQNDYHPLFERFSSLFIPLIVLAAICAFVAIITVVCLVKKAQRNETENKEKILRPMGVLGEENPISDDIMKHGDRPRPTSSNATMPVGTSANEMYETEGWVVPMDPALYALPQKRAGKTEEEDTKL